MMRVDNQQYKLNGMSYYTPLRVEADQKEIIIGQLKGELYSLKKNEQDYYYLEDQFKKLEQKYRLLQEDKVGADTDFRARHDQALRNISQLKNEADALRAQLRDLNLELGDLDTDGNTLRTQLDQRNIEIERLKTDINSLLADSEELLGERARLDGQLEMLKADKVKLLGELKNLECDHDSVNRKIGDLEKYLQGLDAEGKALRDKVLSFENENNGLDDEIGDLDKDLSSLERNIVEAQKDSKQLQNDIAGLLAQNDKNKSEAAHFLKATQAEIMRNNDLAKTLAQAENTLRTRDGQIGVAAKQIKNLDMENGSLSDVNKQLEEDLEACQRHLQNLFLQNSTLLAELERYSAEDESVRALLDRKPRVLRSRARVEETITLSRTTIGPQSRVAASGKKIIY